MRTDQRVKHLRSRLQLTQMELAEQIGVAFSTVNRWEQGRFKPTPLALKRIKELELEITRK